MIRSCEEATTVAQIEQEQPDSKFSGGFQSSVASGANGGTLGAVMQPVHLLVDGSNVMHAWPELKTLLRRDRDAARAALVQRLAVLHDGGDMRLTVVFDGRGSEIVTERPGSEASFLVVYTPAGMTADDVIEQWVGRSAEPGSCRVASADRGVITTVSALGAEVVSPEALREWVGATERRSAGRVEWRNENNARVWREGRR